MTYVCVCRNSLCKRREERFAQFLTFLFGSVPSAHQEIAHTLRVGTCSHPQEWEHWRA